MEDANLRDLIECDNCLEYSSLFLVVETRGNVGFAEETLNGLCFFCNDDDVSLINENW